MPETKYWLAQAVAVILVLPWNTWAASPKQLPSQHDRPSAKPTQNKPQQYEGEPKTPEQVSAPLIVSIPLAYRDYPQDWTYEYEPEAHPEPLKKSWEVRATDAQGIFAFVLTVVGVIQAVLACLQLGTYEGQRRLMRRQANISERQTVISSETLLQTQKAAEAAIMSGKVAEQALRLSNRPWLRVQSELASRFSVTSARCFVQVEITIKNVGPTPAVIQTQDVRLLESLPAAQAFFVNNSRPSEVEVVATGNPVFPGETRVDEITLRSEPTTPDILPVTRFFVAVCVRYGLPSGIDLGFTGHVKEIQRRDNRPFNRVDATFDLERIRFIGTGMSTTR